MRTTDRWWMRLLCSALLLVQCGCLDPAADFESSSGQQNGTGARDAGDEDASDPSRCAPGEGATGSPRDIAEAVALINSLPKPASVDCFVESLDRPLGVNATASTFSLQPAEGRKSPRIFLFKEPLIMSIALDGGGRHLLEFGELKEGTDLSIKGEIEFPVTEELTGAAPYERILNDNLDSTVCAACHASEEPATEVDEPDAFISLALRPVDTEFVSLQEIGAEFEDCDPDEEPERCSLMEALLGGGELYEEEFPEHLPTIFDE